MSSLPKSRIPLLIALVALIGAAFIGGYAVGRDRAQYPASSGSPLGGSVPPPHGVDPSPLWKAWNVLNEKFVPASTTAPKVTSDEMLWGAISGLASSFGDPHTTFLPPEDAEAFETDISGSFEGVGMEVGIRNNNLVIVSPLPGTPAARAGLHAGDRIRAIDGTDTTGMTVERAVKMIRGPKGTTVELLISREETEKPFIVSVVRDAIVVPAITTQLRNDGIFVIKLTNFSALSPGQFRSALREFINANSDRMVLDLRGNPGGFLEAAVDMASWFLPMGVPVVREDSAGKQPEVVHRSKGYAVFNRNLKMAILINKGSASASEILAGALSEQGVAKLIGEASFGKGSVQELIDITDNTSLKVTVARWLTPKGKSISDGGLKPDIEVEMTVDDFEAGRDPQMEAAVKYFESFPKILIINQTNPI